MEELLSLFASELYDYQISMSLGEQWTYSNNYPVDLSYLFNQYKDTRNSAYIIYLAGVALAESLD